jgi:hypothetical protein
MPEVLIKQVKYCHHVDEVHVRQCKFMDEKFLKEEMEMTPQEFIGQFGKRRVVVCGEKITYAVSDVAWDVVLYKRRIRKVILSRSGRSDGGGLLQVKEELED